MAATKTAIALMKAVQVPAPGADLQLVEREIPNPGRGQVRIRVQACGLCHSDAMVKEGSWPGIHRRTSDDRKISTRKGGRGLRANDERRCAIPGGADDVSEALTAIIPCKAFALAPSAPRCAWKE